MTAITPNPGYHRATVLVDGVNDAGTATTRKGWAAIDCDYEKSGDPSSVMRQFDMSSAKLTLASPRKGRLANRLSTPLACLAVLAALMALISGGHLDWLALFVAAALGVAVAYRFPVLMIAALVVFGILPLMFLTTPWAEVVGYASFYHVTIEYLPLLPIAGAVALRVSVLAADRRRAALPRFLPLAIVLASVLAGVMTMAVAMGFNAHPLSAIREFTVSYLGLVTVPYIALFLRSRRNIVRVFKSVALVGVGVPFVLLPLVGHLKGWGIGPLARFYPSPVHMGIVYGLIAAYLLQARERSWRLALGVVAVPAVLLIIVDSHRSVWLAAGVSLIVLAATGTIRLERFWKWGVVVVLVLVLSATALAALGKDPIGYVALRGAAFTHPNADVTASWRLSLWRSALKQGQEHPVFGEGFGSYFDFQLAGGVVTVEPHNFYVQTYLKLGLVGLLTYVGAAAALLATLIAAWRRARRSGDVKLEPVMLMGLVAACASLTYGIAYSFDVYSMVFVGLGLAAALRSADSNAVL